MSDFMPDFIRVSDDFFVNVASIGTVKFVSESRCEIYPTYMGGKAVVIEIPEYVRAARSLLMGRSLDRVFRE
jgi:hypothetical protein